MKVITKNDKTFRNIDQVYMMKKVMVIFVILFGALFSYRSGAEDWDLDILSVDEIRPGMKGIGKTVFHGSEVEDFGVEVIDVLKNLYPQRDVILVRLLGEKVEHTGVVSGMSGSPVYINGKLIGALAMHFGLFMKEPIGGVMPIEAMLEVSEREQLRNVELPALPLGPTRFLNAAIGAADSSFWQNLYIPVSQNQLSEFQFIPTPLLLSGFDSRVVELFNREFKNIGFVAASTGGFDDKISLEKETFKPGSAISQVLIAGDMGIQQTGTVTCVQDHRLLAFGHYLFNLGPINLPLAQTRILTTLPNLMESSKMAVAGKIVGSFRQDRLSGVYGEIGDDVLMVPVRVKFHSNVDGDREFNFRMASDPSLNVITPLYLRIALINAIVSARLSGGESSLSLKGEIKLKEGPAIQLDNFFSAKPKFGFFATFTDATAAADEVAALIGTLLVNNFKSVEIEHVEVRADVVAGKNVSYISSVWCDKSKIESDQPIELIITLRRANGSISKVRRQILLPKNLQTSQVRILISSASALTQNEIQTMRSKYIPKNFNHIIRILNKRRRNDNLYIQVRARDHGVMVNGEDLESLPPSIMTVMNSRRIAGETVKLNERVIHEEFIKTDSEVIGAKSISIRVKPQQRSTAKSDVRP